MLYTCQQMHLFISLRKYQIYIKIYTKILLHVSVYDHHQEASTWT